MRTDGNAAPIPSTATMNAVSATCECRLFVDAVRWTVLLDGDGTELWTTWIDDSPVTSRLRIDKAGPAPSLVLETTWGWDVSPR